MNRRMLHIILPALLLTACGDAAERALRRGNTLLDAGDLSGAIAAYAAVPDHATLRYNLGTAQLMRDSLTAAAEALLTATALDADTGSLGNVAWHNLGHALVRGALHADSVAASLSAPTPGQQGSIAERVRQAVLVDSILSAQRGLAQQSDSLLNAAFNAYKRALRREPTDEDSRNDLALVMQLLEQRKRNAGGQGGGNKPRVPHSARAEKILAQVDSLVDLYRYPEALVLLQQGMQADTTLKQDEEYMKKLDVVNQAAQAQ